MPTNRTRHCYFTAMTTAEWVARTTPLKRKEVGYDVVTGEFRRGPGMWNTLSGTKDPQPSVIVTAATTANITRATALNAGDTLDGVTLVAGDKVLVKDQSAPEENGIYVVGASPARAAGYDTYAEHWNTLALVASGSANAGKYYRCTSPGTGTLNTTAIDFALVTGGAIERSVLGQFAALPAVTTVASTSWLLVEKADGTLAKISGANLIAQLEP